MSDANPTSEASSVASVASPDVISPPFLAKLDVLISQEMLTLIIQSDRRDSLRTLLKDTDPLFEKARNDSIAESTAMIIRRSDYRERIWEASDLIVKMTKLLEGLRWLREAILRREREQDTEQTRKEDQLREDVRREKELHKVTLAEVEALQRQLHEERENESSREVTLEVVWLRAQLSEERKLRKEARLARDQFPEQNNEQGGLTGESQKENSELLEKMSKERGIRKEMRSEIHEEMKSEFREEMKSEIEELRAELLMKREHLREKIKGEMRLEQAEQEGSRRAQLEQQAEENRSSEETTARD